jgi:DNA protecting protein DprA
MKSEKDIVYWIALAHLSGWNTQFINQIIHSILFEKKMSFEEFFALKPEEYCRLFGLSDVHSAELEQAKAELPNNGFLAEYLHAQGFAVIPFTDDSYPVLLKKNIEKSHPVVLYVKGNTQLLNEKSAAIIGSRNALNISLEFTARMAKRLTEEHKVIVSGFARGVDRKALDEAIAAGGQSIIVLPQGVLTFSSGMKKYYRHIVSGDLLVLSTFHPRAAWSIPLAMARNRYIFGLAEEIYVSQSGESGGTWAGVLDGLRRGRQVFVRAPDAVESNGNNLLLQKGAVPVDMDGNVLESLKKDSAEELRKSVQYELFD